MAVQSVIARAAAARESSRLRAAATESFPALLGTALVAQIVVLSPVLNTGFWNDDDANAYTIGYIRWVGQHFWSFIWSANKLQVDHFGRPMPLGVIQTYGTFDLIQDRVVYKLLLLAFTLFASAMLALVVRRLGASAPLAALTAALPAVAWELHLPHDPLVSYVGLVQTVTIYICAAILLFTTWLRRGGHWRIALVVLFIAAANVTYEDAYLFPLLFVPIAWHERRCSWARALVLSAPALITGAAFILLAAALQHDLASNSGYQPSYSPGPFLVALAKVLTSGLPIIGWGVNPGPRGIPPSQETHAEIRGILVAMLLFPLLFAASRAAATSWLRDRRTVLAIFLVIVVIMLTPAALTAIAPQYQVQLQWGWGYLPMFFVVLGWAAIAAGLIGYAYRRVSRQRWLTIALTAVLAGAGGVMAAVDAEGSARVVAYMQPAIRSRDLIQAGFSRGLLSEVPASSSVLWYGPDIALPTGIWVGGAINLEAWTRQFVPRPLTMRIIEPTAPSPRVCTDPTGAVAPCALLQTPTYWLRTQSDGSQGFVAVAEAGVRRWRRSDNTLTTLSWPGSEPLLYVQDPDISGGAGTLPFAVQLVRPGLGASSSVDVPSKQLHVLRRAPGWVLVRLEPQARFETASLAVRFR